MLFWVSFCADVVPHLGFRNKFCDREHLKTFRLEYCETVAIWRHQFTYTVFTSSIIWMVIKKPHFTLLIPCTLVQSAHKSIYGINKTQFLTSTGWHKKKRTFEKPNKNWRNPRKKYIDRNWTITTCLLRASNPNYQCLKITSCRWRPPPSMHSFTATTHFKSSRFLCHPVCVACSAECDSVAFCRASNTHTGWHKRTGTFEMRSGSERMHTWRRTPSTGRNFQTLIIWFTVS